MLAADPFHTRREGRDVNVDERQMREWTAAGRDVEADHSVALQYDRWISEAAGVEPARRGPGGWVRRIRAHRFRYGGGTISARMAVLAADHAAASAMDATRTRVGGVSVNMVRTIDAVRDLERIREDVTRVLERLRGTLLAETRTAAGLARFNVAQELSGLRNDEEARPGAAMDPSERVTWSESLKWDIAKHG